MVVVVVVVVVAAAAAAVSMVGEVETNKKVE